MSPARPFVTVVTGLPRSGTSLAMQMLHAGGIPALADQQRVADADNPRGYFELERVKHLRTDHAWLADAVGRAVKVIHLLLPHLPDQPACRVLFMDRDLREVMQSQAQMLARSGKPGGSLPAERMMALFADQLAGARRWLAGRSSIPVLQLPYARLVAEPLPWARQIDAFLGGGLDVPAMAAAVDPTLHRNRA